jgi:L-lactate dehydrogenase (cytochrome)
VTIASAGDFRDAARRRIPRFLFDYADGGGGAEETLRRNVSDLSGIALRQRVLRDVAAIDLTTTLFGRTIALPVALGPVGIGGMYARRGELQAARAARPAFRPCRSARSKRSRQPPIRSGSSSMSSAIARS